MDTTILDKLNVHPGNPVSLEALRQAFEYWRQLYTFYLLITPPGNPELARKLIHIQAELNKLDDLISEITPEEGPV